MTRHVGMPSWATCLLVYFLTRTITFIIHIRSLASFLDASSRALFPFPHPPAPILPPLFRSPPIQSQPDRGGSVEGVHPPSPSTFAPWSSRPRVVCFCAPRRLPDRLKYHIFMCGCANSRKIHIYIMVFLGIINNSTLNKLLDFCIFVQC